MFPTVFALTAAAVVFETDSPTELLRIRKRISALEAEITGLRARARQISPPANTSRVQYVHKSTYATSAPLAAAQFAVDYLDASGPGLNRHKCGATNTVTFKGTATAASDGNDFVMDTSDDNDADEEMRRAIEESAKREWKNLQAWRIKCREPGVGSVPTNSLTPFHSAPTDS